MASADGFTPICPPSIKRAVKRVRKHSRSGRLWEDRFKSVIVEDGVAARTIAAYINLNPVRAGIVEEPAAYRWSSYGEAIGGGAKGHGNTARAGLVRAWGAHKGLPADARLWGNEVAQAYRIMLMGEAVEKSEERVTPDGQVVEKVLRKGMNTDKAGRLQTTATGQIPRCCDVGCGISQMVR